MRAFLSLRIWRVLKSLRLRIFLILFLTGLLSSVITRHVILANYTVHASAVRQAELSKQLRTLSEHLQENTSGADGEGRDVSFDELMLFAVLNDARILVINTDLNVTFDTASLLTGKTLLYDAAAQGLKAADENGASRYDEGAQVFQFTTPLMETRLIPVSADDSAQMQSVQSVRGLMLTRVSADSIGETRAALASRANRIELIVIMVTLFFSLVASNLLVRPFDRVTKAIHEIKAGYTDEPISVPDYLETEHITGAFNQLQARMKALDDSRQEFVSNVSHELKTPITSMKVLADTLLAEENAPVEAYRDFLRDISDEVVREDQIINDLLALVRMDKSATPLNITSVNVGDMTEIVLKRLRPIARQRNIELTFESTREITAEIDEVKISLAIMNLVENAIKYNHDGGWVKTELDADHQFFTLKVSDSGIGIPASELDSIYERFYRVDKSRSREITGTGLGLSVTRQAIIMHRGEIEVQSTEGVGTIFTIRVPLMHMASLAIQEEGT